MIRTANLTDSISRKAGGLHESVRRLVQSLDETGVGVRVLAAKDEFTDEDLALWQPVPVDVFPRSWPKWFGYSPGFLQTLNAHRPDLIHTHGIWLYPSIATTVYCVRRRMPYMISPHGMVDPWAVRHQRWKKVIAYALYETNHVNGARCIRALCESEARSVRQMGLTNPIAVIPNGIDLPEIGRQKSDLGEAPWGQQIELGSRVLLYLGRIHPKKGLASLLKAWAAQKSEAKGQRSEDWNLVIAGWDQGGYEAELKSLASDLGLLTSVKFLGPQFGEAKAACYRYCDAFVLPSLSEGLPMVVLEAWAYAKPVLMTAECNLPEGFDAGAALRMGTTVEDMSEGLAALFTSGEAGLKEMGARGRQLAQERFAWDRIAAQLKVTYEWMLGGGPKPGAFFWN